MLAFFWYRSFPPHDAILTAWCGSLFVVSVIGCVTSYRVWVATMQEHATAQRPEAKHYTPRPIEMVLFAAAVLFVGWESTEGDFLSEFGLGPYSADLYRAELAERPDDWLPYEEARAEFMASYAGLKRHQLDALADPERKWTAAAKIAFQAQRDEMLTSLRARDFPNVNLRGAILSEAFMPSLDLRQANLNGAYLIAAQMERADLLEAQLEAAILVDARLEGANLIGALLQNANLSNARLEGAVLVGARMGGANLNQANLERADLGDTWLEGADFSYARLNRAQFFGARMQNVNLVGARMPWTNFGRAQLQSSNLSSAHLEGANLRGSHLSSADLTDANLEGASMAWADLTDSNITFEQLDRAFGDAATARTLPDGIEAPDHWSNDDLSGQWQAAHEQWCEWRVHRVLGTSPYCYENPFNP